LFIFGVDVKNLKDYRTSKKDREKGTSKMPSEVYRIDENLQEIELFLLTTK
jgi:hypothetical protein